MGLFDVFKKKDCEICGKEVGLLGYKKLEDGEICKDCVKLLSPWFDDRRHSTVEQIKSQLEAREHNKLALETWQYSIAIGDYYTMYVKTKADVPITFVVSNTANFRENNADILPFLWVASCTPDIRESHTELKQTNAQGEKVSFNPPRYEYRYDFYIKLDIQGCPYIDDMRLLKNICNEFLIYYNRVGSTASNPNKMLAIVTYKNIFPKDFSELQLNRGFVYAIFAQRKEIIKKEEIALESKIDELNKEISDLEKEKLQNLREVDAVFVDKFYKGNAYIVLKYGDTQLTNWLKAQLSGDRLSEYENRRKLVEEKISYEHINKEIEKRTVQENKDKLNGTVRCIFQTAEEISGGAKNLIEQANDYTHYEELENMYAALGAE